MASTDRGGTSSPRAAESAADPGQAQVALEQAFDAEGLYSLRSAVAAHGADLGLTERRIEDLILVAHELASNAIRHGGATATTPARLRLWRDGDRLRCEVTDRGPGIVESTDDVGRTPVPLGASSGRGLWIIRQVVDRFEITSGPDGTTVTMTMNLDGHTPPRSD